MSIFTEVVNANGIQSLVLCPLNNKICTIPSVDDNSVPIVKITKFNTTSYTINYSRIGLHITHGPVTIEDHAFEYCSILSGTLTIPNSVTSIGKYAFKDCHGFNKLIIPNSVTYIGKCAFQSCFIFSGSVVVLPDNLTSINERTFADCHGIRHLDIPNSVTSIGDEAFYKCGSLVGVLVFPDSVTTIGNSAFEGCFALNTLEIPKSVKIIGNYAFADCSGLQKLVIHDGLTIIGNHAFEGCSLIDQTLVIPDSVTIIGEYAFALTQLAAVKLPPFNTIVIGISAFPNVEKTNKFIQTELEIEAMPRLIRKQIRMYTKTVEINRFLRDSKRTKSKRPGEKQRMLRMLRWIDLAFSLVTPLTENITVFRGIKNTSTFYTDDLGYTSTSENLTNQIKTFAGDTCCMLEIRVPAGSRVLRIPASVGYYGDENEVLLFRGGKFKEVGRRTSARGFQSFKLDYIEGPLPDHDPQLLSEMRNFMNTNFRFFELLKDDNRIQKFEELTKKNPSLMFRCLISDISVENPIYLLWGEDLDIDLEDLKEYFEIILTNYPNVTKTIEGLDALFDLHNATSVENKIHVIYTKVDSDMKIDFGYFNLDKKEEKP